MITPQQPGRGTVYQMADVRQLTGAKRSQVENWVRLGIIEFAGAGGAGVHRQFTFRNVFEAALAVEMQRLGIPTSTTKELLTVWRRCVAWARRAEPKQATLKKKMPSDEWRHIEMGLDLLRIERASTRPACAALAHHHTDSVDPLAGLSLIPAQSRAERGENEPDVDSFVVLDLARLLGRLEAATGDSLS